MKLELKNLAPYLPYGLKMQYVVRDVVEKTGVLTRITHDQELTHPTKIAMDYYDSEHIWMFKPILRPLSDLSKDMALLSGYKDVKALILMIISGQIPYYGMVNLFENHYDVFGLIKQGLAIDINTLTP